ncbi:4016_t:CDS:2 [Ambispora gerdemannii]|uniref:4016_t:CDS:1 n=1 Tax=Ambispora gerdemannii TaxID=144530 RepID=A0A9N9FB92_9GLOM|nr:4016_t:CDS:2 [Ambispora gerdemannii]
MKLLIPSNCLRRCISSKTILLRQTCILTSGHVLRTANLTTTKGEIEGPPQDPIPTPPPGVPYLETLLPPEKTGHSIKFPWVHNVSPENGKHPQRIKQYPYKPPNFWTSLLSVMPFYLNYNVARWITVRTLKDSTSPSYFPDEFMIGASLGLIQVCKALSSPPDRKGLEQMFTTRLFDRFSTELDNLEAEKSTVSIKIPKIHDSHIQDVWLTMGPRQAFARKSAEFDVLHFMTLKIGVRQGNEEGNWNYFRNKLAKSVVEGIGFKVDVAFDVDVIYTLKSAKDEVLIFDQCRRILVVRFESPYFEPSERIMEMRKDASDVDYYNSNDNNLISLGWNWRVGDIDYLLESEDLEIEERENQTRAVL